VDFVDKVFDFGQWCRGHDVRERAGIERTIENWQKDELRHGLGNLRLWVGWHHEDPIESRGDGMLLVSIKDGKVTIFEGGPSGGVTGWTEIYVYAHLLFLVQRLHGPDILSKYRSNAHKHLLPLLQARPHCSKWIVERRLQPTRHRSLGHPCLSFSAI
jgi:hypothetical protein